MQTILQTLYPLIFIITLGIVLSTTKIAGQNWVSVLNIYSINVGFPSLIFLGTLKVELKLSLLQQVVFPTFGTILLLLVLSILIIKILKPTKTIANSILLSLVFGNIAFLGIPFISGLYGDKNIPITGLIASIYIFFIFTFGIFYLEYQNKSTFNVFRIFRNPLLIAVILGILINILPFNIDPLILQPIELLKDTATPIALLSIGLFIGHEFKKNYSNWKLSIFISLVRLFVFPAILYLIFKGFKLFHHTPYDIQFMEAAMPIAITPFALSSKYDLSADFIAKSIIASTLISFVSLLIWFKVIML